MARDWDMEAYTRFVGEIPNAEVLLPVFDVLCLCSRSEGLPNALLEASAAALPIVAMNVGGVAEAVEDQTTGFLIPPDDLPTLVDRLLCLLANSDLRRRFGQAGRERVCRTFSTEAMSNRVQSLYDEFLSKKTLSYKAG